jgi:hypothetical protein
MRIALRKISVEIHQIRKRGVEKANSMKLRFLLMGCIISAIDAILLIARGFSSGFFGLLLVGIVLLVLGLLWK